MLQSHIFLHIFFSFLSNLFLITSSFSNCESLILICWKKWLLWWALSDALIYGYRDMSLGVFCLPCSFSRVIVAGFPLSLWPLQYQVLGHFTVSCVVFIAWSGPFIQLKAIGYSCIVRTTIAAVYWGQVIVIGHRVCIWVIVMTIFLFQ